MSRFYKNIVLHKHKAYGKERRENIHKEILKDSTPLPKPVTYEDIDNEFKNFVNDKLKISFEGNAIPTISLFTNQRFSEYLQSWSHVDDKKNMLMNFKTITRENNPMAGTINGNTRNIPGNRTYLIKRVKTEDRNGRTYYVDYRMKQPFSVDLKYKVSIVTNKYVLINEFNTMINDAFKSITNYIFPNGHSMSMILDGITDESEYKIDDRQFYSQTFQITVRAYIIKKEDFTIVERPELKIVGFGFDGNKNTFADIEEYPCDEDNPYRYKRYVITVSIDKCSDSVSFRMDSRFKITEIEKDNVRNFKIKVNDELIPFEELLEYEFNDGDEVIVKSVNRFIVTDCSTIKLYGYCRDEVEEKEETEN